MAKKAAAGQRALEVMPPDQRAIFEKVFEMDAARHAAGIPSAIEYHRALGEGQIDPAVAAAHRWLDSFLPEDADLQWRRMMGASGDRGKNIATVLHSPLGLGAQAAPNTVIPGSLMPVYSGDRRGYRPPPLPAAPGATPAAPQPYTTANRPSLFGPLEARRDWALAKVRELETIAADPNRSQRDRDSAKRGARQITRDIANYQGMPFTPEELSAEVNPLLARMDSLSSSQNSHQKRSASLPKESGLKNQPFEAMPLPHPQAQIPAWVSQVELQRWQNKFNRLPVKDPISYTDLIGPNLGNTGPVDHLQIQRALQSFLDFLPADIARAAGKFEFKVVPEIVIMGYKTEMPAMWVPGEWRKVRLNGLDEIVYEPPQLIVTCAAGVDELTLRGMIWHEMGHWLWDNADKHPRLTQWRNDLEDHFIERTAGNEPEWNAKKTWQFCRDRWVKSYAGRLYPDKSPGVELPSVYLEILAEGSNAPARWTSTHEDSISTFDLTLSIFGDYK